MPRAKIENFGYDGPIPRQPGRFALGDEERMLSAHIHDDGQAGFERCRGGCVTRRMHKSGAAAIPGDRD
jgi:hypothetical protein